MKHGNGKNEISASGNRVASIDALRGFDMFFIMGGAELIMSICALWPNAILARVLTRQMIHVDWNGLRFYDYILPLFLFIAGLSFPYSLYRQRRKGADDRMILLRILKRSVLLIFLGILYNGFLYGWTLHLQDFRFASVLARLGISSGIAALIYTKCNRRQTLYISAAILILYWIGIGILPRILGLGNPFSIDENLVARIDRHLVPGRLFFKTYDPEGLVGAIPCVVTVLSGMLSSSYLAPPSPSDHVSYSRRLRNFLTASVVLIISGVLWGIVFPINKAMWSSSFVCVTSGISMILFALFYDLIDIRGYKKAVFPFRVIGMNAITIYLAQAILSPRWIINGVFGRFLAQLPDVWSEIAVWSLYVVLCWMFLYLLYRKKIFLKV